MTLERTDNWDLIWTRQTPHWFENADYIKKILSKLPASTESATLLDLGCGRGKTLQALQGKVARLIGVDKSQECLSQIPTLSDCELICADARSLPLKEESVDILILGLILEHIEKIEQVLLEVKRVLKSGGFVLVVVPNQFSFVSLYVALKPWLLGLQGKTPLVHIPRNLYPLRRMISNLGFTAIQWEFLSIGPYLMNPLFRFASLLTRPFPILREEIIISFVKA